MLNSNCSAVIIQELLLNHGYNKAEIASLLELSIDEVDLILLEARSSIILTSSKQHLIKQLAQQQPNNSLNILSKQKRI